MTKMRVHELAKELGMENKQLMDILVKKNVEVKSHMSSLADEVVDNIRKSHKGSPAPAAKPAQVKPEEGEKAAEDGAPKKKNIVQVFRPQNSKSGARMGSGHSGQRPQGNRPAGNTQGARPQGGRPAGAGQGQRP